MTELVNEVGLIEVPALASNVAPGQALLTFMDLEELLQPQDPGKLLRGKPDVHLKLSFKVPWTDAA